MFYNFSTSGVTYDPPAYDPSHWGHDMLHEDQPIEFVNYFPKQGRCGEWLCWVPNILNAVNPMRYEVPDGLSLGLKICPETGAISGVLEAGVLCPRKLIAVDATGRQAELEICIAVTL